jgi:hypothetical protein
MSRRKSKNNRRCIQGRFTENPKQYLQFLDEGKYNHIINEDFIEIVNNSTCQTKAIFDYEEVCRYLKNLCQGFASISVADASSVVPLHWSYDIEPKPHDIINRS